MRAATHGGMLAQAWHRAAAAMRAVAPGVLLAVVALLGAATARAQAAAPALAANPEAPAFDILEYQVEGNTVLDVTVIERVLEPFLGPRLGMAQVEAARSALERAYQGAGWQTVFVDVPEQRVDGGVVRLAVLEGRVERLQVSQARYFSQGHIRAVVDELTEGRVPNFNRLQAQLAQVNRSEDRRVQPVLKPGRAPGTLEADLKVTDRLPLALTAELHNHHANDTDPLRLALGLRYDNLFQLEHALALNFVTAPRKPQQSRVFSANYSIPDAGGAAWLVYGVLSDSLVEPLGATTVIGQGATLGLRRQLPAMEAGGGVHSLSLGLDFKSVRQRIDAGGDTIRAPLRYLPMSLAYAGSFNDQDGATQLSASLVLGTGSLLQRTVACPELQVDQFECARHGADGRFAAWRAEVRHERPLGEAWRLAARLAGQLATQPLVSGEQFVAGGAESVRGYLEAESAGDHGVLASLELRTRNLGPTISEAVQDFSLLAFVDLSLVRLIDPLPEQAARIGLAGLGVGLRTRLAGRWTAALDLAQPLRLTSATRSHSPRLQFKLGASY